MVMTFGIASRSRVGAIGASIRSFGAGVQGDHSSPASARPKSFAANGARSSMPSPTPMKWIGSPNFSAMRDQDAAARGAVELGHDQAGDAGDLAEHLDLRQRVLADGGVEHEQHRVRRAGVELLHHAHHLFQLAHQLGAVLQPAGGVDDQHVGALGLAPRSAPRRRGSPNRRPARARSPWRRCARPRS